MTTVWMPLYWANKFVLVAAFLAQHNTMPRCGVLPVMAEVLVTANLARGVQAQEARL